MSKAAKTATSPTNPTVLIDANSDYADSFELVDGVLRLNAESAQKVAEANAQLALSEAEVAQAAQKAKIDKTDDELANVEKQLRELEKTGDMSGAYARSSDQRDGTRSDERQTRRRISAVSGDHKSRFVR